MEWKNIASHLDFQLREYEFAFEEFTIKNDKEGALNKFKRLSPFGLRYAEFEERLLKDPYFKEHLQNLPISDSEVVQQLAERFVKNVLVNLTDLSIPPNCPSSILDRLGSVILAHANYDNNGRIKGEVDSKQEKFDSKIFRKQLVNEGLQK